jgi:hypothetical protein
MLSEVFVFKHTVDTTYSIYQEWMIGIPLNDWHRHIFLCLSQCRSWIPVLKRGRLVTPISGLTSPYVCAYYNTWILDVICCGLFCGHWVKMRGDCSFCWYWWNCWHSLFLFITRYYYTNSCHLNSNKVIC